MPHVNDMTREELIQACARLQAERDGLVKMMAHKYEYVEQLEGLIAKLAESVRLYNE